MGAEIRLWLKHVFVLDQFDTGFRLGFILSWVYLVLLFVPSVFLLGAGGKWFRLGLILSHCHGSLSFLCFLFGGEMVVVSLWSPFKKVTQGTSFLRFPLKTLVLEVFLEGSAF